MEASRIYKLKMSEEQIGKFQTFMLKTSGLVFEGRRLLEMEKAIAKRLIELGISSFEEYYDYITSPRKGEAEFSQLVLSLTVGETQFFRTPDQFAALRKYVLPELIERKRANGKELFLLSAGCATGEEPYSLCIMLDELIPDIDTWRIDIRACDINKDFLAAARKGVYSERKVRLVDPMTREAYFERKAKNLYKAKRPLRSRVEFIQFSITSDDYLPVTKGMAYDLVLCRNVLIYFNLEIIKKTIDKFYKAIAPDGYLMLGYSETLFKISEQFQSIHTPEAFFYQKSDQPKPSRDEVLARDATVHDREDFLYALGSRPHPLSGKYSHQPIDNDWFKSLTEALAPRAVPPDCPAPALAEVPPERPEAGKADNPGISAAPPQPLPQPAPDEDRLWEEALDLFAEERFDDAQSAFQRMLEANPCSARANIGLAFLHANTGSEERSREHAELAKQYDDLLPELYLLLALLDEKNGDNDRARRNYQRVLMLDSDYAMARFNLGNLYLKMHMYKDAAREFGNTISILERDHDNRSLRFSGGLSREAAIEFCKLQREQITSGSRAGRAG